MFFVQMCYSIQSTFIQETGKKYSAELGVTVTHYENMVETSGWLDGYGGVSYAAIFLGGWKVLGGNYAYNIFRIVTL